MHRRAVHGDSFAMFLEPPGLRDLACPDLWEDSLERSLRRRRAAAERGLALPKSATGRLSATLAAVTLAGSAAPAAMAAGDLRAGGRGTGVTALQRALGVAADGVFGPQTRAAVRAYQRAHGLAVDGIVGPQTRAALGLAAGAPATLRTAATSGDASGPAPAASTTTAVQRALGLPADGVYGPQTRAAVRAYQAAHGLEVDGVVGPQTLGALGIAGAGAGPGSATTASPASGSGVQAAVAAALSKQGAPYSYGSSGPSAFDCSGLTSWAFRQAGITIPRTSFAQYGSGSAVSRDGIQAGDLVFFDTAGPGASDVGLATGPTTVVSATTHGVMVHPIFDAYWGSHFVGARRVA